MYPTLIDFGPIAIHSFGLMMALGFLAVLLISDSAIWQEKGWTRARHHQ